MVSVDNRCFAGAVADVELSVMRIVLPLTVIFQACFKLQIFRLGLALTA